MARLVLILACSLLSGQQTTQLMDPKAESTTAVPATTVATHDAPKFQERHPRYQLEAGDIIELLFAPSTEYNQTVTVQPDGYITLREVGDTYVRGKTVPELRAAIALAYSKILHEPEITVTLKDFEKPHFIATGQVGHPGKYELRADTTVTEALAIAGGLTEKSKHSQVLLFRRVSNDWVETKLINVKAIFKGQMNEDIHIQPGDMLYVPQNTLSKIKPFLPVWALSTYLGSGGF